MALRIATHDDKEPITVQDRNQLNAVLEAASDEHERRTLSAVILDVENGNFMTMVVGGSETVLSFDYGHLEPSVLRKRG